MRNPEFKNKEDYLTYRSTWKVEYAELSKKIREYKWANAEYSRTWNKCSVTSTWIETYNKSERILKDNDRFQAWRTTSNRILLADLKYMATVMLEERKASKVRAQEQYVTSRESLATV